MVLIGITGIVSSARLLDGFSSNADLSMVAMMVIDERNDMVVTDYPAEEVRPHKVLHAPAFFVIAIAPTLTTEIRFRQSHGTLAAFAKPT